MFSYGVDVAKLPEPPAPTEAASDADAEMKAQHQYAEEYLAKLETLSAPRLLIGAKPYVVAIMILIGAAVAGQLVNGEMPTVAQLKEFDQLHWKQIGIYSGIAGMALLILGVIVRFVGKSQARKVYQPMRQAIASARQACKIKMDRAHQDRETRRQRANHRREMEVQAAKDKFSPSAAKMAAFRDKTLATHVSDHGKRVVRVEQQRDVARTEMDAWQDKHLDDIQKRADHDIATARKKNHDDVTQSNDPYEQSKKIW